MSFFSLVNHKNWIPSALSTNIKYHYWKVTLCQHVNSNSPVEYNVYKKTQTDLNNSTFIYDSWISPSNMKRKLHTVSIPSNGYCDHRSSDVTFGMTLWPKKSVRYEKSTN